MQELDFRRDILPLKDKLFRLAYRITFNRAEAEDIVQDTMMRVWNKREELGGINSIEAFCLVIAKNLAIDRIQRKEAQHLSLDMGAEEMTLTPGPYEKLISRERIVLIERLMNGLPEKQRLIMQLRDVEGHSYKEIAGILELTEEQVKVYLFRARKKVREQYREIDEYGL